jgi:lysozyme family protein
MDHFLTAWLRTGREEGGYVNNPNDAGGATNHGITERVARANGFLGDMRDLPKDRAREIAKASYWDTLRLDGIAALSPRVAYELFDTGFLCGQGVAARFLQRCLNVGNRGAALYQDMAVDGIIGPVSIQALRIFLARAPKAEVALLNGLNGLQSARLTEICEAREKDEEFWLGWQANRVAFDAT